MAKVEAGTGGCRRWQWSSVGMGSKMLVYAVCPKCSRKLAVEDRDVNLGIKCKKCDAHLDFARSSSGGFLPARRSRIPLLLSVIGILAVISGVAWWLSKSKSPSEVKGRVVESANYEFSPSIIGNWYPPTRQGKLAADGDQETSYDFREDGTVIISSLQDVMDIPHSSGGLDRLTWRYQLDKTKAPYKLQLSRDLLAGNPFWDVIRKKGGKIGTIQLHGTVSFNGPYALTLKFTSAAIQGEVIERNIEKGEIQLVKQTTQWTLKDHLAE